MQRPRAKKVPISTLKPIFTKLKPVKLRTVSGNKK